MNERLKALYQEVILQHQKSPYHYFKMDQADKVVEAYNPLCGDQFKLFLQIEDSRITSMSFHGYGCAISKASSSVLVQLMEGKTKEEARSMCKEFMARVSEPAPSGQMEPPFLPGEEAQKAFEAFTAAREFPGRVRCATLSWEALQTFLNLGER